MEIAANTSYHEELSEIQVKLMQCIDKNPGIRYRELLRLTSLANGVLTYHLKLLERSCLINVDRKKIRTSRYYTVNIPPEESDLIGYFRNDIVRQIIVFVLEHELCTFDEIVERFKKSPSTMSWHLKRLKDAGIISVYYGKYQLYKVTNREVVAEVLYKYKESFVARIIDNYTEMIDEL
jgi:predicted transcriptional regulator